MSQMATERTPREPHQVAADLTDIQQLYAMLPEQAINDSDDPLMPGGRAMVALGPVANQEAWEAMTDAGLRLGREFTFPELEEDDKAWPAFQIVNYWAAAWRRARGWETEKRPTMLTELAFIRYSLDWAWDNEDDWPRFTTDITNAKTILEDITTAGRRTTRGVQCLGCSVELVRIEHDRRRCEKGDQVCARTCTHDRGGLTDQWKCPKCQRRYQHDDYTLAVHHAHFVHADYLTLDDAAQRTGEKAGTIKVWASRGFVKRHRDLNSGRMTYCVADILERSEGAESA